MFFESFQLYSIINCKSVNMKIKYFHLFKKNKRQLLKAVVYSWRAGEDSNYWEIVTYYRLEMDMDKETFIATGQTVVLEHEDFTGRCQRLDYDNQGEIMEMVGDPVLTRKEGDTVKGDRIRLNLKDETFEILDNAEMAFEVEEEDDADDGGK